MRFTKQSELRVVITTFQEIVNQYTGEKRQYFLKQLNQCELSRFTDLSSENGIITVSNVREAKTTLQCEFKGFHEPNAISRPMESEFKQGNILDARFRKFSSLNKKIYKP